MPCHDVVPQTDAEVCAKIMAARIVLAASVWFSHTDPLMSRKICMACDVLEVLACNLTHRGGKAVVFTSHDAIRDMDHIVRLRGLPGLRESRALLLGLPVPLVVTPPQTELARLDDLLHTTDFTVNCDRLEEVYSFAHLMCFLCTTWAIHNLRLCDAESPQRGPG